MFEIGVISCVHGLEGDVVLRTYVNIKGLPKYVFVKIDGTLIPFKIEKYSLKGTNYIVKFDDVLDRKGASEIIKKKIFIQEENIDEFIEVETSKIIGFSIVDKNLGHIGIVDGIEKFPAHDCIIAKKIDDFKKKFLIPFVDEIVKDIDENEKIVKTDFPKGLV